MSLHWGNVFRWETAFHAGRVFALLDGLDEVSQEAFPFVRNSIEDFAREFSQCPMVLTCRVAAREYVFEQFAEVEIADFTHEQIKQFARRWFYLKGNELKASQFFSRIGENYHLAELASNPLLLTLLCLVFEERSDFEGSRGELYEEGFNILLRKWDATRSIERDRPYRRLNIVERESLLADLAYSHFVKGEYFFDKSALESEIARFFEDRKLLDNDETLRPETVLNAIESQHGLLVERAMGIYSFSHLTFQEYLTAKRIARNPALLPQLARNIALPAWREVWLLLSGMMDAQFLMPQLKLHVDMLVEKDVTIQKILKRAASQSDSESPAQRAAYIRLELDDSIDLTSADAATGLIVRARINTYNKVFDSISRWLEKSRIAQHAWLSFRPDRTEDAGFARSLAGEHDRTARMFKVGRDIEQVLEKVSQWEPLRPTSRMYKTSRWVLSNARQRLLVEYLAANLRLVECMKSAKSMKADLYTSVEEHLLLPFGGQTMLDHQIAARQATHWRDLIERCCKKVRLTDDDDSQTLSNATYRRYLLDYESRGGDLLFRMRGSDPEFYQSLPEWISEQEARKRKRVFAWRLGRVLRRFDQCSAVSCCECPFEISYSDGFLQVSLDEVVLIGIADLIIVRRSGPNLSVSARRFPRHGGERVPYEDTMSVSRMLMTIVGRILSRNKLNLNGYRIEMSRISRVSPRSQENTSARVERKG